MNTSSINKQLIFFFLLLLVVGCGSEVGFMPGHAPKNLSAEEKTVGSDAVEKSPLYPKHSDNETPLATPSPNNEVTNKTDAFKIEKNWWHLLIGDLVNASSLVITGKVEEILVAEEKVDWLPRNILTSTISIAVVDYLKGASLKRIKLKKLGGCLNDVCMEAPHEPIFEKGERTLLFLQTTAKGEYLLVNGFQGKINLDRRYLKPESGEVEVSENDLREFIKTVAKSGKEKE